MVSVIRGSDDFDSSSTGAYELINRTTISNVSSYVFTATDSSKYSGYHIEFEGPSPSTNTRLEISCSDDGGSTYDTSVRSQVLRVSNGGIGNQNISGYGLIADDVGFLAQGSGHNLSGFAKICNPHSAPTTGYSVVGQVAYRKGGGQFVESSFSLMTNRSGATSQKGMNAFRIKPYGSFTLVGGTIAVFGIRK